MKAMVLPEFGDISSAPLKSAEVETPKPGEGQVLVRVKACGLCHTDLHTIEGELPAVRLPIIPGHQIVGRVEAVGTNASRFVRGERVGAAWLHSSCGRCDFCLRGRENLCREARFTGYHVNGGYAEYFVISEPYAYALPGIFSDQEAAPLLCAGIIGFRALRLSEIQRGQRLGLYGFGASAHVAIQVARHWGCEVYVFSRSASHRRLAEELGAAWTGKADDTPPAPLHSAVIFAPAAELVPEALRVLERGGTLALAGITMTALPGLDYARHLYQERTLRSVANATRRDGQDLLAIAAEIPIRTVTRAFRLDEANEALKLLKDGRIDGAAVLCMSE